MPIYKLYVEEAFMLRLSITSSEGMPIEGRQQVVARSGG